MPIYIITTVNDNKYPPQKRNVGSFSAIHDAIKAIEHNECDIAENGRYRYCVVESLRNGLYPIDESGGIWFEWDYARGYYKSIGKPIKYDNLLGWWM